MVAHTGIRTRSRKHRSQSVTFMLGLECALETECVCPFEIHMLKPNSQCDGRREGAFQKS